jgi:hypothetical protein
MWDTSNCDDPTFFVSIPSHFSRISIDSYASYFSLFKLIFPIGIRSYYFYIFHF